MKTEKVSIVTPCYNGEKYLERFLKSILNQSYGNIELIFINDGSTDQTEEIIKKYKEEFDLHNIELTYLFQENAGQAAALNNGLKYVQGDYLLCMDSDDEISENVELGFYRKILHMCIVMEKLNLLRMNQYK